jgi:hypothetical protein
MPQLDSLFDVKSHVPALLPIGAAAKRIEVAGDIKRAKSCIDWCALYSIDEFMLMDNETISCESMHLAESMEFSVTKSEGTTLASLNTALETACLRNENPEPQSQRDEKMEYCPPTPANSVAFNETLDRSDNTGLQFLISYFCCYSPCFGI